MASSTSKKVSNEVRFRTEGSASTWPKSGFTEKVKGVVAADPYFGINSSVKTKGICVRGTQRPGKMTLVHRGRNST